MCGTCGCAEDATIRLLGTGGSDVRKASTHRADHSNGTGAHGSRSDHHHDTSAPATSHTDRDGHSGHANHADRDGRASYADHADHSDRDGHSGHANHADRDGHASYADHADHADHDGHTEHADRDGHTDHVGAPTGAGRVVVLQQKVLEKNDRLAERNREWLADRGILAVNLMSSPGAGKTTLLERTARELGGKVRISVIEGDQETSLDAGRIEAAGCNVVQINTGAGCHLDADMIAAGLRALDPPAGSLVVIENVGNLVCPALFDLGEQSKVVVTSVTEGAEKPLKYPQMFGVADLVVLNKTDLLPYVDFDTGRHAADLAKVSPHAEVLRLSATTGDGVHAWYQWLSSRLPGQP
jgi:hydrogenase nickel incorporation protein HypB